MQKRDNGKAVKMKIANGDKLCCYCGKWFESPKDKSKLLICPRCSAGEDANPFSSEGLIPWHKDPRADLIKRGEEGDE